MWLQSVDALTDVLLSSEQYMQVQDQPAQMWNPAQAALQKIPPMQMPMKQQPFYMAAQDPLKLYEQQLQAPAQPQLSNMDKKMKYPDFYWETPYRMGDGLTVMADRMKRPPPGGVCAEQEAPAGPRGPPFEVSGRLDGERGDSVLSCFSCSVCVDQALKTDVGVGQR